MIYFEDVVVGERRMLGSVRVDRGEALEFARLYDPQPFHLDEAAAAAHPFFKRLSISGWQTCGYAMRLTVAETRERGIQVLGSPGIDHLRWLAPVYPGDILILEAETLEVTPSRSRPTMGAVKQRSTMRNQDGEIVMTMEATVFLTRRPVA